MEAWEHPELSVLSPEKTLKALIPQKALNLKDETG